MNYWILNPNNLNILTILFPIKLLTDLSLPFQFLFTSKKKKREKVRKREKREERDSDCWPEISQRCSSWILYYVQESVFFFFFWSLYFFFLYNWLTISPNPFTWLYLLLDFTLQSKSKTLNPLFWSKSETLNPPFPYLYVN